VKWLKRRLDDACWAGQTFQKHFSELSFPADVGGGTAVRKLRPLTALPALLLLLLTDAVTTTLSFLATERR